MRFRERIPSDVYPPAQGFYKRSFRREQRILYYEHQKAPALRRKILNYSPVVGSIAIAAGSAYELISGPNGLGIVPIAIGTMVCIANGLDRIDGLNGNETEPEPQSSSVTIAM